MSSHPIFLGGPTGVGEITDRVSDREKRLDLARRLHRAWKDGALGGEHMPEDAHPDLPRDSETQRWDLAAVREFVTARRGDFPYLCGPKIVNYWLYVLSQHLTRPLTGRERLTVAPDRHVIEASRHLGLVPMAGSVSHAAPQAVAESWRELLEGTELSPIDLHTPLWLWNRLGRPDLETLGPSAGHSPDRVDAGG
jgi:hypothetical protein